MGGACQWFRHSSPLGQVPFEFDSAGHRIRDLQSSSDEAHLTRPSSQIVVPGRDLMTEEKADWRLGGSISKALTCR